MTLCVIECVGEDAVSFLQTQLTADVETIAENQWRLGGYCNPKGRLFAVMFIIPKQSGFFLVTESSVATIVLTKLNLFKMRAQVTHSLRSDLRFQCAKNGSGEIQTWVAPVALKSNDFHDLTIALIDQSASHGQDESDSMSSANQEASIAECIVKTGLPLLTDQVSEAFIPQSVNLDLVGGVSFKKGCYPGQEIVARVRYRGKPKHRMVLGSAPPSFVATPGDDLVFDQDPAGRQGKVVSSVMDSTHARQLVLASIPVTVLREYSKKAPIWNSVTIELLDLPYPVTLGEEQTDVA